MGKFQLSQRTFVGIHDCGTRARRVVSKMKTNADFQQNFAEVKAEIAAAHAIKINFFTVQLIRRPAASYKNVQHRTLRVFIFPPYPVWILTSVRTARANHSGGLDRLKFPRSAVLPIPSICIRAAPRGGKSSAPCPA
jgi:hypothetical protein